MFSSYSILEQVAYGNCRRKTEKTVVVESYLASVFYNCVGVWVAEASVIDMETYAWTKVYRKLEWEPERVLEAYLAGYSDCETVVVISSYVLSYLVRHKIIHESECDAGTGIQCP